MAQSGVVAPNDNLVTDRIPPIPASVAALARRYNESRAVVFWDWHPTRPEMLISTRFDDGGHERPRSAAQARPSR